MSKPEPYECEVCGADLTEAVAREREQDLDVLRVWRRKPASQSSTWSVRVWCPDDHENVFSG